MNKMTKTRQDKDKNILDLLDKALAENDRQMTKIQSSNEKADTPAHLGAIVAYLPEGLRKLLR